MFVLHKLLISITHQYDAAGRAQLAQLAQFIIADLLYLAEIMAGYKNN